MLDHGVVEAYAVPSQKTGGRGRSNFLGKLADCLIRRHSPTLQLAERLPSRDQRLRLRKRARRAAADVDLTDQLKVGISHNGTDVHNVMERLIKAGRLRIKTSEGTYAHEAHLSG